MLYFCAFRNLTCLHDRPLYSCEGMLIIRTRWRVHGSEERRTTARGLNIIIIPLFTLASPLSHFVIKLSHYVLILVELWNKLESENKLTQWYVSSSSTTTTTIIVEFNGISSFFREILCWVSQGVCPRCLILFNLYQWFVSDFKYLWPSFTCWWYQFTLFLYWLSYINELEKLWNAKVIWLV